MAILFKKNQSKLGDFELRYSLRSLEKNLTGLDSLYVIGDGHPDWLHPDAFIEHPDPWSPKDANLIAKTFRLCSSTISERFLITSDDHYLMQPAGILDLSHYWREIPSQFAASVMLYHANQWHRRHADTLRRICPAEGLTNESIESHVAYPIEASHYTRTMSRVAWGQGAGAVTHLYGAYWNRDIEPLLTPPTEGINTRLKEMPVSLDQLEGIKTRWLNHNDKAIGPDAGKCLLRAFLRGRFPEKSRWEK